MYGRTTGQRSFLVSSDPSSHLSTEPSLGYRTSRIVHLGIDGEAELLLGTMDLIILLDEKIRPSHASSTAIMCLAASATRGTSTSPMEASNVP